MNRHKRTSDIAEAASVATVDVDNWMKRLELRTDFENPGRGRSRTYSYDNALEISFLGRLVELGLKPSSAAAYAWAFVENVKMNDLGYGKSFPEYLAFYGSDYETADQVGPETSLREVFERVPSPLGVSIIRIGEAKRKVDRHFETIGK